MRFLRTTRHFSFTALALGTVLAASSVLPQAISQAQQSQVSSVTITLALPTFLKDTIGDQAIKDFEAQNPGTVVQVVSSDVLSATNPATDVGKHLDAVQQYSSEADVLLVYGNGLITPEATRAGYYLNLQPLIDSDSKLNKDEFYPQLFNAYQWDQGTWALPIAADATVLTYNPDAFDKANVPYPTANWTIDNLIDAVKKLSVVDAKGNVTSPGIDLTPGGNDVPLYMSLIGKSLADSNSVPNPPNLNLPEVSALFARLPDLLKLLPLSISDNNNAPIKIESIQNVLFTAPGTTARKAVLLPGGHAYLSVSGVAVSAATQYPEKAYALASFLTQRKEVRFGVISARKGGESGFGLTIPADIQPIIDQAIANGYTPADRRFYEFLSQEAIKFVQQQGLDPVQAVADAQQSALAAEQNAVARKTDTSKVAVVATPIPTPDASQGTTIKFGITFFGFALPRKAEIQALADQFAQQNPGVAKVTIQNGFIGADVAATKYDCFYLPYSAVPSIQLDTILNLDPYLTTDSTYNAADYLGGMLNQVQRDNKTWALPMGIQPTVMWYDPTSFANAGAQKPVAGWTVDAFKDSLNALKPFVQNGQAPFYMSGAGGEGVSMLMLIAAYGGTPIDWNTNPPTINFTDANNVAAMRQVLDLARNGFIDYKALGSTFGAGGNSGTGPLYSEPLNGFNFGQAAQRDTSNLAAITFPKGSKYQGISYSEGSLYISATAQNPDACYKWIKTFAQHPELLSLMPANRSQLASADLETTNGKTLAAVYRDIGTVLDDPSALKIPSLFDGGANISGFIVQFWLFRAWDNYVLKNQDLDSGLQDAQTLASGYLGCVAALPPFDPAQQKYQDYLKTQLACATKVDPSLKSLFGAVLGN